MSDDQMAYDGEARTWERDAQELRNLLAAAGYTQVTAAEELGYTDRSFRGYCSGREPVPTAVLYAMRWVAEHKPNRDRWLQVHWKKVGREVKSGDKFDIRSVNEMMQFSHNFEVVMRGTLDELVQKGLVTVHASYSSDRFLWGPPERRTTKTEPIQPVADT